MLIELDFIFCAMISILMPVKNAEILKYLKPSYFASEVLMSDNAKKNIELPSSMSVRDLAQFLEASPIQVIKSLMNNGVMASINQLIDFDTAAIVAEEFGFDADQQTLEGSDDQETGE